MTTRIKSSEEYKLALANSIDNPGAFWEEQAETFKWREKWHSALEWNFEEPKVEWFKGGKLNITENCLDRHLDTRGDQIAILWEPNDPNAPDKKFTYRELHAEVCKTANALKSLGVSKGDRVCFYMPMVPELAIGVLACARIGAIHSVVFAGFSALALADRINDSGCKVVICSDFNNRGKKHIPVKAVVDDALEIGCESIKTVIVHRNAGDEIRWNSNLDVWWHDIVGKQSDDCPAEIMDAEDPLFILYTSGSTGKPKGVLHTCGGYMVFTAYSFKNVFQYEDGDIFWCTADIGWITGHSYIIYGPLLSGATSLLFEGIPTFPDASRFWQVCEKYQVTQFYTAPTAIRALMAQGDEFVERFELNSIKILGSVGEPINEEAWQWYHDKVGKGRCFIVDTWWQTETGGILITPIPGATDCKPTYASYPLPGVQLCLVDPEGNELEGNNVQGLLCIKFPWPSIIRTTYGDHERCRQTYFAPFPGKYFTGDSAKRDEEGRYRIIGRVDDVINVSGHRIGTAEVEDAIDTHEDVVEAAVVGYPHPIKGQGIYAFVITHDEITDTEAFTASVRQVVANEIGAIAKPDRVQIVPGLPKTRSGKIMRRILRKIASGEGDQLGDVSTLFNPEVVDSIREGAKQ